MKLMRAFWNSTDPTLPYLRRKKLLRSLTLARPISSREVALGMTSITPHCLCQPGRLDEGYVRPGQSR